MDLEELDNLDYLGALFWGKIIRTSVELLNRRGLDAGSSKGRYSKYLTEMHDEYRQIERWFTAWYKQGEGQY